MNYKITVFLEFSCLIYRIILQATDNALFYFTPQSVLKDEPSPICIMSDTEDTITLGYLSCT